MGFCPNQQRARRMHDPHCDAIIAMGVGPEGDGATLKAARKDKPYEFVEDLPDGVMMHLSRARRTAMAQAGRRQQYPIFRQHHISSISHDGQSLPGRGAKRSESAGLMEQFSWISLPTSN